MKPILILWMTVATLAVKAQCSFEKLDPYYYSSHHLLLLKDGGFLFYGLALTDTVDITSDQPLKLLLYKLDACGNIVWIKDTIQVESGGFEMSAVETDGGNIIIVRLALPVFPEEDAHIRIEQFSPNGTFLYGKTIDGNPGSRANGIIKNEFKPDSYFIYGCTDNSPTSRKRPLVVEIDGHMDVKQWKELDVTAFENPPQAELCEMRHLFVTGKNSFAGLVNSDEGNMFIVGLDSNFSVAPNTIKLEGDSMMVKLFEDRQVFWNKNRNAFEGYGTLVIDSFRRAGVNSFITLGLDGNVQHYAKVGGSNSPVTLLDTVGTFRALAPAKDGGYIATATTRNSDFAITYLYKLDGNFVVQWTKPSRGLLFNVAQLADGGYLASGGSMLNAVEDGEDAAVSFYFGMYSLKTDSLGSLFNTGIDDKFRSEHSLLIYPNPSSDGIFYIQSNKQSYQSVDVYTITGQLAAKFVNQPQRIDLIGLANNMYLIVITDKEGNTVHRQRVLLNR